MKKYVVIIGILICIGMSQSVLLVNIDEVDMDPIVIPQANDFDKVNGTIAKHIYTTRKSNVLHRDRVANQNATIARGLINQTVHSEFTKSVEKKKPKPELKKESKPKKSHAPEFKLTDKWNEFETKYGDFPAVKWDKRRNAPRIISGRFEKISKTKITDND